ncbi:MAG: hypothetical protein IJ419_06170 [Agathobacter sp.]|nr:hypothetical protein [Agathobacter sp.]
MKKYVSAFEMLTRSTLYKVLAVIVIMVGGQISLFWGEMTERIENTSGGIESIVDNSYMIWLLAVGFVLITVILCWSGCNIGSNQGYTLRRLQIPELAVFGLQAVYNCLCYILLWASQVAMFVITSSMYLQNAKITTNQTMVIAFYRNPYMHSILPMEDAVGWISLAIIICACGMASAAFPFQQRRGKIGFGIIVAVGIVFLLFPRGLDADMNFIAYYSFFLILAYWVFWGIYMKIKEEKKDE